MNLSLLLVIQNGTQPERLIQPLEPLLERVDPKVDVLCLGSRPQLEAVWARLEAMDLRLGHSSLRSGPLGQALAAWIVERRTRPVIVLDRPPSAHEPLPPLPTLVLGAEPSDDLRQVVVACDEAPVRAAQALSSLCRGAATDVVFLQSTGGAPLEAARRRVESAGAATLVRRARGRIDLAAEAADADLVVLERTRATEPLVSSLLTRRSVLLLPPTRASQACA